MDHYRRWLGRLLTPRRSARKGELRESDAVLARKLQPHAVALAYRYFAAEFAFEFVRQRECLGQGVVPGANVDDGE